jgi:hypothetical protein
MGNIIIVAICVLIFLPRHTLVWRWVVGTLVGIDCTLNCFLLLGDYRETISGRLGKAYLRGVKWVVPIYWAVNILFLPVDRKLNHCIRSIDPTVGDKTIWRWGK